MCYTIKKTNPSQNKHHSVLVWFCCNKQGRRKEEEMFGRQRQLFALLPPGPWMTTGCVSSHLGGSPESDVECITGSLRIEHRIMAGNSLWHVCQQVKVWMTEEHSTSIYIAGRLPQISLIRSSLASPDRRQDRRWYEGEGCTAGWAHAHV